MALATGTQAPDFTLVTLGSGGPELFTLSEHVGKKNLVLLFFPMAFTGGCTTEFCDLMSSYADYEALDAEVVGISGDGPFAQQAWADKEGIKIRLLSDYEHAVTNAYDVAYDSFLPEKNLTMGGVAKRSAFVVDKSGVIRYSESNDNPAQMPDFDAIKAVLKDLA